MFRKLLTRPYFNRQLVLAMGLPMAALFFALLSTATDKQLQRHAMDHGRSYARTLALQAGSSLYHEDAESVTAVARSIQSLPHISGVALVSPQHGVLYREGAVAPLPENPAAAAGLNGLPYFEDDQAWYFAYPVLRPDDSVPVAMASLALSKASLLEMREQVLTSSLLASILAALVLALTAALLLRRPPATVRQSRENAQDSPVMNPWDTSSAATASAGSRLRRIASPTDQKPPTLDRHSLNQLRNQIGPAFKLTVDAFLKDNRGYIEKLGDAAGKGDFESTRHYARLIRGSAGNLAALKLAWLCQKVDQASRLDIRQVPALVKKLEREFSRVQRQLRDYLISPVVEESEAKAPPKILVVDDDHSSRLLLQGVLEKGGYDTFHAENGLEALQHCKESMPDLILMDALMPVMDGFTACERIMALGSPVKPEILMITALEDEGTIERAFAAGAVDFILKPFNVTVLRQRVSRVLQVGKADRHIHILSHYDNLTSLPNRGFFMERGGHLLDDARERGAGIGLIFVDVDRFKMINESWGHDAGDQLLMAFSERLRNCLRPTDLVSRLSGDAFTVILDNLKSPEGAATAARKILSAMKEPFKVADQQIHVSISIGIAVYPDNGENIGELMRQADSAIYRAKARGGNHFEFYQQGMEAEVATQMKLDGEIRRALERDEFVLFYQPQVDLHTGLLTGVEALIRWKHPTRGLLPPGEFIPFAEKSELITRIGDWVMREACLQLRHWLDTGFNPVPIAVNVSGRELGNSILLSKVERNLRETRVPAHLLKLEITEDTLAGTSDYTVQHLQELRRLGITLAIDDFGTGYSSLSYLKLFPVDTLKIDRSFVKDLPGDANGAAITASIIALGHSLKLTIIAEGVETEEQREFLRREGCDIMQGYLLSKPLPVLELQSWIASRGVHPDCFKLPLAEAESR